MALWISTVTGLNINLASTIRLVSLGLGLTICALVYFIRDNRNREVDMGNRGKRQQFAVLDDENTPYVGSRNAVSS